MGKLKEKVRAEPRGRRNYPQEHRVFSKAYLANIVDSEVWCFVPHEDFRKLEKKYFNLFKRYIREVRK